MLCHKLNVSAGIKCVNMGVKNYFFSIPLERFTGHYAKIAFNPLLPELIYLHWESTLKRELFFNVQKREKQTK